MEIPVRGKDKTKIAVTDVEVESKNEIIFYLRHQGSMTLKMGMVTFCKLYGME
jgi:hypothetical protein